MTVDNRKGNYIMKIKAIGTIALALLLLGSVPIARAAPAAVATQTAVSEPAQPVEPRYEIIMGLHGTCYIQDGTIWMSGSVNTTGTNKATYAYVKISLQSNRPGKWVNEQSWSKTGTYSATKTASKAAQSDRFYRLKIYGYVSSSSGSESDTIYTSVTGM